MQVLARHDTPAGAGTLPGAVLLIERDHAWHPWVTCWRADGSSSWCHGHYFERSGDAWADFYQRAARGY